MNQVQRIKEKLELAKKADPQLKAFGASSHQYSIHSPVNAEEIQLFEREYGITLPLSYKTFLLEIGNGGRSFRESAAGPYYGIYPLGNSIDELVYESVTHLQKDCVLYPGLTEETWEQMAEKDPEELYAGILPIGSQGCTYIHGLVLNGPHTGKVVNLDLDGQRPKFTFEKNFLDWYERWLDETISGELINSEVSWFGFTMKGTEEELVNCFISIDDSYLKESAIWGLMQQKQPQPSTLDLMVEQVEKTAGEQKKLLLMALIKFDYKKAKPFLLKEINHDPLMVLEYVSWYAKKHVAEWKAFIVTNIQTTREIKLFNVCVDLLRELKANFEEWLVKAVDNQNKYIRSSAIYELGQLKNKKKYLDVFIKGLNDEENHVIHATLQALEGVDDKQLLPHYKNIAKKFPVEQDYILSNLNNRLKPFGLDNESILL